MKTANMSVKEILASNNNGQGKTNTIAESCNVVGEVITYDNIEYTVNQALQSAKLIQYFSRENNPAEVLETLEAGYLGKLHQKTMESEGDKKAKPSEQAKKLLTADEYLQNCLQLAKIDVVKLHNDLLLFGDKSTKADLLDFIVSLRQSLVSAEQTATYEVMCEKESSLNELKTYGFTDFRRYVGSNGSDTFNATITVADWPTGKAELVNRFNFICAVPKDKNEFDLPITMQITFTEKQ